LGGSFSFPLAVTALWHPKRIAAFAIALCTFHSSRMDGWWKMAEGISKSETRNVGNDTLFCSLPAFKGGEFHEASVQNICLFSIEGRKGGFL
jgi:hypothetical protein